MKSALYIVYMVVCSGIVYNAHMRQIEYIYINEELNYYSKELNYYSNLTILSTQWSQAH